MADPFRRNRVLAREILERGFVLLQPPPGHDVPAALIKGGQRRMQEFFPVVMRLVMFGQRLGLEAPILQVIRGRRGILIVGVIIGRVVGVKALFHLHDGPWMHPEIARHVLHFLLAHPPEAFLGVAQVEE